MLRNLVLGAFAAIAAFWSYYFWDRSTEHERQLKTRDERIGETAMGGDGIDLWRAAFSHVRASPRTPRYARVVRLRSTAR